MLSFMLALSAIFNTLSDKACPGNADTLPMTARIVKGENVCICVSLSWQVV